MERFAQSFFHMQKSFFPTLRNTLTKAKNFLMKRFIAFFHEKDKNVLFHEIIFARKDAVLHQVHPMLHEILQGILPWVCRNQGKVDVKGFLEMEKFTLGVSSKV